MATAARKPTCSLYFSSRVFNIGDYTTTDIRHKHLAHSCCGVTARQSASRSLPYAYSTNSDYRETDSSPGSSTYRSRASPKWWLRD